MGSGTARRSRQGKRGLGAVVMMAVVLLACGASTTFKPLPAATMAPGIAPFEVVTLGADALQARAGRDGRLLWQTPMVSANGGALLAADGIVFHRAQGSEAVEAFAADSGALLWRLSECSGYDNTLTAASELLFVTCGANVPSTPQTVAGGTLYALDAATGSVRWQAHGERFRAVTGDLVITQTPTGLAARTLAQGAARWSSPLTLAPQGIPDPNLPNTPDFDIAIAVASNGMLYLSPDGRRVVALRTSDGTLRWQSVPLAGVAAPGAYPALVPVYVVAGATADTVVARATSGARIVALSSDSGEVRWHTGDAPPGSSLVSLVTAGGTVFVNGFEHPNDPAQTLRRLDPATGAMLWSVTGPVLRTPPLWSVADALYVGDGPQLFALRASDGKRLFDDLGLFPMELAADANVIAASDLHNLYLLSALDGKQIWEAQDARLVQAAPIILPVSG